MDENKQFGVQGTLYESDSNIDLNIGDITIDLGNMNSTGTYTISSFGSNDTVTINSVGTTTTGATFYGTGPNSYGSIGTNDFGFPGMTNYGRDTIKTSKGKEIDLDDLADTIETIKRRLLILTPNFEMHEKYPMLKEMYEEYLAIERLLSGPDTNIAED